MLIKSTFKEEYNPCCFFRKFNGHNNKQKGENISNVIYERLRLKNNQNIDDKPNF